MGNQMNARIAFYKAKGDIIDKSIRLWTRSKYSHCEIVIGKNWYSSSPRDNGVRAKQIVDDNGSWDFVEMDIEINKLNEVYLKYKGSGYDFLGILLCMILPLKRDNNKKVTCSEFCAEVLGYSEPEMYSPQDVWNKIKHKG